MPLFLEVSRALSFSWPAVAATLLTKNVEVRVGTVWGVLEELLVLFRRPTFGLCFCENFCQTRMLLGTPWRKLFREFVIFENFIRVSFTVSLKALRTPFLYSSLALKRCRTVQRTLEMSTRALVVRLRCEGMFFAFQFYRKSLAGTRSFNFCCFASSVSTCCFRISSRTRDFRTLLHWGRSAGCSFPVQSP